MTGPTMDLHGDARFDPLLRLVCPLRCVPIIPYLETTLFASLIRHVVRTHSPCSRDHTVQRRRERVMWCMEETKEGRVGLVRACEMGTGRMVREMEKGKRERVGKRVGEKDAYLTPATSICTHSNTYTEY